jgi:ribosomal protein S18 acetylase RimI-like enzyme
VLRFIMPLPAPRDFAHTARMALALTLRLAVREDARAIAELSRREIEHGLPWRWTPPRVLRAIRDRGTNVVVALEHDLLAGFGVMAYGEDAARLSLLAVDPNARRRGVGTALLLWLERVAGVAGLERIELEARQDNDAALAFYRRHGYQVTETMVGYYLGMEDGVRLRKLLAQVRQA